MTIAAAYLTSEGVVLGADSATTVSVEPPGMAAAVAQVLTHAQKVFEVGDPGEGRFGLCTWGAGSVCGVSHRTVAARLADEVKTNPGLPVAATADALLGLVSEILQKSPAGPREDVGYFLGGWNLEDHLPECYQLRIPAEGEPTTRALEMGQAMFSGAPQFFTRVFRGFDPALPGRMAAALKERLSPVPEGFDRVFKDAFNAASGPLVAAGLRDLPIREAIDYVHTYLHVTVKVFKFMFGAPVCGGPIEVAFVTTDRRFRWVCHKRFDSAILEEEVSRDGR
jgi:hypothetical protein